MVRETVLPHWETAIQPLISALPGGIVVEIGAARGETTKKLALLAEARGISVHSIDPTPRFDAAAYECRYGKHFRFHCERSHEALDRMGAVAAALIDGDHNWYTVHGELSRLSQLNAAAGLPFPLVMLHDVEWPYARRDMYYDPDSIPAVHRKPWARRGIKLGESLLDEDNWTLNPGFANAIEEGGPRNGVLTAVEEFIEESSLSLEWRILRGDFGLGILVSRDMLAQLPALQKEWRRLHSTQFLLDEAERLSNTCTRHGAARLEMDRELRRLRRELQKHEIRQA